jgi:hypothetical protein
MMFKHIFVGLCALICSVFSFCEQTDERKSFLAFANAVTLLEEFTYLEEKPLERLMGNVSGILSTNDPQKLRELVWELDKRDLLLFDYDEVLCTSDGYGDQSTNFRVTHPDISHIFHAAKEKTHVYILSFGNSYAYECSQFGMIGNAITEPLRRECGTYINPLPEDNDLSGFSPFTVPISGGGVVDTCIDFCEGRYKYLDEPLLSIYPTLGAFHVARACWHPGCSWHKIKKEEIERISRSIGCDDMQNYILKYLYAKVPLKGKIMKTVLTYLSQTGGSAVPRDILFVDDSLLNCKAFLYYVRELKRFGSFTGNVKVVHLTIPHNKDNSIEEMAIAEVEKAFGLYG